MSSGFFPDEKEVVSDASALVSDRSSALMGDVLSANLRKIQGAA